MMNTRNHKDFKLISRGSLVEKWIAKLNVDQRIIFTDNLVNVYVNKTGVILWEPICLGLCILDSSKTRMHEF